MSDFLDKLAQQNSHLADGSDLDETTIHLASAIEVREHGMQKQAHHSFDRIDQHVDMHQGDPSPDFWIMKEGTIVRNSEEVQGGQ